MQLPATATAAPAAPMPPAAPVAPASTVDLPGRGARRASTIFALPETLPDVPTLRSSGYSSRDMTPTVFVGRLTDGREGQVIGYESLAQRGVNGAFADALAAAKELATSRPEAITRYRDGDPLKPGVPEEGDDPASWKQLGESSPTGVAAILQARDGSFFVAPAFVKTFADDKAFDTIGLELPVSQDGFPIVAEAHSREFVALVSADHWADLREAPEQRGVV